MGIFQTFYFSNEKKIKTQIKLLTHINQKKKAPLRWSFLFLVYITIFH